MQSILPDDGFDDGGADDTPLSQSDLDFIGELTREWQGWAAFDRTDRPAAAVQITVELGILRWGRKYKVRLWVSRRLRGGGRYRVVGHFGTLRDARRAYRAARAAADSAVATVFKKGFVRTQPRSTMGGAMLVDG